VDEIFHRPTHPYTRMLISSLPSLRQRRMPRAIPGLPPGLIAPPPGCLFHPRCPHARAVCSEAVPEPRPVDGSALGSGAGHVAACHLFEEIVAREGERAPVAAP
jgi:oligopeptide/dipeptide ABC transporter ATP-binding protein